MMHKTIKGQYFEKKTCTLRLPSTIKITRINYFEPQITITIGCNSNTPQCYYEIGVVFRYVQLKGSS